MDDQALDDLFRSEPPAPALDRMEALFTFFDSETRRLRRRGVTLLQLWYDYCLLHPDGIQQTSYYHYYNVWKKRTDPSMHMEHKAGDKIFVDFAGEKLKIIDTTRVK
jgi:transposase